MRRCLETIVRKSSRASSHQQLIVSIIAPQTRHSRTSERIDDIAPIGPFRFALSGLASSAPFSPLPSATPLLFLFLTISLFQILPLLCRPAILVTLRQIPHLPPLQLQRLGTVSATIIREPNGIWNVGLLRRIIKRFLELQPSSRELARGMWTWRTS